MNGYPEAKKLPSALPVKVRTGIGKNYYEMRRLAISKVGKAINKGLLPRLTQLNIQCTDCKERAVVYDHRDYKQPLKVDPVCNRCNQKRGRARS